MYFTLERNESLARTLFQHVRDGSTELVDEPFEYDPRIYSSGDVAALERTRIFQRLPMLALLSSQVPEPNSFATVQLNRSNVLVTRRKDGTVAAFLNVCRHRGATVVTERSGQRARFACPYHNWTYGTDGALKTISCQRTTGVTPSPERNLVALPVEERHGFIWIVEDAEGTIDVAAHLGSEMDRALAEYGIADFYMWRDHVFDFAQNWKVMMDGLIDAYHAPYVHGETLARYVYNNVLARDPMSGDHLLWGNPRKAIDRILDEEPGASPLDRYVVFANLLMPNTSMVLHPHHIELWSLYQHPDGPHRSLAHLRYVTRDRDPTPENGARYERNWQIAEGAIINEDVPIGDSVQRSAAAPSAGTLVLGCNEIANQHFHRHYQRYMERA